MRVGHETPHSRVGHNMKRFSTKKLLAIGAVGLAAIAFLAFGVFGVQTLFIDETVDEANPFAIAVTADDEISNDEMVEAEVVEPEVVEAEQTEPDAAVAAEVVTLSSGLFADGAHPTSGNGTVLTDGVASFLRFEEFATDNGPDLNVYLRSSANPDDFIDLGDLKGNIGDQNYELPADFDAEKYDVVDIWCVRFSVSFGSAQLTSG